MDYRHKILSNNGTFEALPYRSILFKWVIVRVKDQVIIGSLNDEGFAFEPVTLARDEQLELLALQGECAGVDLENKMQKLKDKKK